MSSRRRSRSGKVSRWEDREEKSEVWVDRRPSRKGPAGLIFMCNSRTKGDCFHYKVLGLPLAKRDLVEQIVPGTLLFLFDFDAREVYGIFEAVSPGGINLEPKAFRGQGSYPAQVRFDVYRECLPLPEDHFRDAIKENYHARNRFDLELNTEQVSRLTRIFCPVEPPRKRLHVNDSLSTMHRGEHQRQPLPERATSVPAHIELVNRDLQYKCPAEALRMEEMLLRQDSSLRLDPGPLVVGAMNEPYLPQIRGLDGRPDRARLLTGSRIEEVDLLALKYLQQGNPAAGNVLDPRGRSSKLRLAEVPRALPGLQHEDGMRRRALEAELLSRAASERVGFRDQGALYPLSGPALSAAQIALLCSRRAHVDGQSVPRAQSAAIGRTLR